MLDDFEEAVNPEDVVALGKITLDVMVETKDLEELLAFGKVLLDGPKEVRDPEEMVAFGRILLVGAKEVVDAEEALPFGTILLDAPEETEELEMVAFGKMLLKLEATIAVAVAEAFVEAITEVGNPKVALVFGSRLLDKTNVASAELEFCIEFELG